MQIFYFITDYLLIKWHICICIFWTTGYGKEINLPKPAREICENATFSKDTNSSVT